MHTLLISAAELQQLQARGTPIALFDCSFDLMKPEAADALFADVHIAGAQQAHLDRDLSTKDPQQAVNGGRHPLPRREIVADWGQGGYGIGVLTAPDSLAPPPPPSEGAPREGDMDALCAHAIDL